MRRPFRLLIGLKERLKWLQLAPQVWLKHGRCRHALRSERIRADPYG